MAKNEHLRSVFDWIQIQFDKTEFSPREIIEDILFLDYDLFIENKGSLKYYDYDSQLHHGNIRMSERVVLHACHVRTGTRVL